MIWRILKWFLKDSWRILNSYNQFLKRKKIEGELFSFYLHVLFFAFILRERKRDKVELNHDLKDFLKDSLDRFPMPHYVNKKFLKKREKKGSIQPLVTGLTRFFYSPMPLRTWKVKSDGLIKDQQMSMTPTIRWIWPQRCRWIWPWRSQHQTRAAKKNPKLSSFCAN